MSAVHDRRPARTAGPDLLVLARWEEFLAWLLEHTARWPKSARFGLVRRVDDHALDVLELLIVARYEPGPRKKVLREANLRLERLRHLLRIAHGRGVMPATGFETAMRGVDEVGRMLHGWRQRLEGRGDDGAEEDNGGGVSPVADSLAAASPDVPEEAFA